MLLPGASEKVQGTRQNLIFSMPVSTSDHCKYLTFENCGS